MKIYLASTHGSQFHYRLLKRRGDGGILFSFHFLKINEFSIMNRFLEWINLKQDKSY